MTWVIGASSIFGYGALMSDVRVTFRDGREVDLLQKAFAVGPFIVAGFAGSVRIGFQLLHSLSAGLVPPTDAEPGMWEPEWVAEHWQPEAQKLFATADPQEQKLCSQILLVGISYKLRPEVANNPRALKQPRVCLIRFDSPTFEPVIVDRPLSVMHIGSGAAVARYTGEMQYHFQFNDTLKAEMGQIGMWPKMLARSMGKIVAESPVGGISPHVHILVCRNGEIFLMNNNETRFPGGGAEPIEFKMPVVAGGYRQFCKMCEANALTAEGAVA